MLMHMPKSTDHGRRRWRRGTRCSPEPSRGTIITGNFTIHCALSQPYQHTVKACRTLDSKHPDHDELQAQCRHPGLAQHTAALLPLLMRERTAVPRSLYIQQEQASGNRADTSTQQFSSAMIASRGVPRCRAPRCGWLALVTSNSLPLPASQEHLPPKNRHKHGNSPTEVARAAWTRPGRAAGAVNAAAEAAHAARATLRSMLVRCSPARVGDLFLR